MGDDAKILIAFFIMAAVIMTAVAVSAAISDQPRQFGDKVCIKVGKDLKCEPIAE